LSPSADRPLATVRAVFDAIRAGDGARVDELRREEAREALDDTWLDEYEFNDWALVYADVEFGGDGYEGYLQVVGDEGGWLLTEI